MARGYRAEIGPLALHELEFASTGDRTPSALVRFGCRTPAVEAREKAVLHENQNLADIRPGGLVS